MKKRREIWKYLGDFFYATTKYPNGWFAPRVVRGKFPNNPQGELQKRFFEILLANGFKRTFWQLVFPGQIAGLVKKVSVDKNGANEYHARFYRDGTIDCELEVGRFDSWHWSGARRHGVEVLEIILKNSSGRQLNNVEQEKIISLFGEKHYSQNCLRAGKPTDDD